MIVSGWHVGCASSRLKAGDVLATAIGREKIALFRDVSGRARALKDRCCHRGFPLSRGKVQGGRIACGFHGWEFNGEGVCEVIPSQVTDRAIPKSHCVPSFACIEKDGYVWVSLDREAGAPTPLSEVANGSWMQGSREIHCNYLRALEITFDGAHLYFVHPTHPVTTSAKKFGFAEGTLEIRITDTGCLMFGPASSDDVEAKALPPYGFMMEFTLPGRISFYMLTPKGPEAYMFFHTTPLGEDRCRMDWLYRSRAGGPDGMQWTEDGSSVIDEDQIVLELIEKAYRAEGDDFEKSVEADFPTLTLRRIARAAEKGEWGVHSSEFPRRRVISVMGPANFEA